MLNDFISILYFNWAILIIAFLLQFFVGQSIVCHRKECTNALDCMQGWDNCADKYCYMIRAMNVTNPMQFNLRRGCIGDPAEIKYSKELKPFTFLNQCQRIVWKDIEYLLKICADVDFCNFCDFWLEALPVKSSAKMKHSNNSNSIFLFAFLISTFFVFY